MNKLTEGVKGRIEIEYHIKSRSALQIVTSLIQQALQPKYFFKFVAV